MALTPKSLSDHILLWFRWRWFLIGTGFLAAIISVIIVLFLPKTYKSTVRFLPPHETGSALPFLDGVSLDIFGANEVPASSLTTLLKSNALKERVNQRIDLQEHYKEDDIERAYLAFEDHLEIEMETEESFAMVSIIAFALSVIDKDPEFCARLVNVTVEEWNQLFIEINQTGARLRREFLEENLYQTADNLALMEDSMRVFQENYGITSINEQVKGTVQAAIALEQEIMNTRITVQILEKLLKSNHPELQRAQLQLKSLLDQQNALQGAGDEGSLMVPLGLAPELGLQYTRYFRRIQTLEAIHGILVQQYEQAKMQEIRKTPAFRIVDWGEVPLNKYKPRRIILVAMATFSAIFLALLAVYFLDYIERVKGTEESLWIDEIVNHLQSDLKKIRGKK